MEKIIRENKRRPCKDFCGKWLTRDRREKKKEEEKEEKKEKDPRKKKKRDDSVC